MLFGGESRDMKTVILSLRGNTSKGWILSVQSRLDIIVSPESILDVRCSRESRLDVFLVREQVGCRHKIGAFLQMINQYLFVR